MVRTGYILNQRADLVWFLGLPFLAIAFAMASQQWLPAVALASITLWITIPHHFATWLRTFGTAEDRRRFADRLIIGPIVILVISLAGLSWAPLTTVMLVVLWDHQHSIMQQHGFARIYDFKAGAGAPSTRHFDLALNWILYGNLMLTAPLFAQVWLRWLYRWDLSISPESVQALQTASWAFTGAFCAAYALHVAWSLRRGYAVNPLKYVFIAVSYFLWYFTARQTDSLLVHGIAHRIMHGVQYIVIAYWYTRRKEEAADHPDALASRLVRSGNLWMFILACVLYAVAYQLLIGRSVSEFGFGFNPLASPAVPEHGLQAMSPRGGYELYSIAIINTAALTHYYFDSFIWKVRDQRTQSGL